MIHTLRAPLTAFTVAAVTAASAISAPADTADHLLVALAVPSSNQVALTAWQNPIVALLDSGELAENYVFGRYYDGVLGPKPGAGEVNWPFVFRKIDEMGFRGWIGCEYRPAGETNAGLGWFAPYKG
jgi:hypothetical protein